MNKQILALAALVTVLSPIAWLSPPPQAPANILARCEKRTPISTLPFNIDECGSYFLTRCLSGSVGQNGITVTANDVTIDLNGFALIGVVGSTNGIEVTSERVSIFNGQIRDWGGAGIAASSSVQTRIDNLRSNNVVLGGQSCEVSSVQLKSAGITLGTGSSLVDSKVTDGVVLAASGSRIQDCELSCVFECTPLKVGAGSTIAGCSVSGFDAGIETADRTTVEDCTVFVSDGAGIRLGAHCTVSNCSVTSNPALSPGGIIGGSFSSLRDCVVEAGILLGSNSIIQGCIEHGDGVGVQMGASATVRDCRVGDGLVVGAGSSIVDCSATAANLLPAIQAGSNTLVSGCNASGDVVLGDDCTITNSSVRSDCHGIIVGSTCSILKNRIVAGNNSFTAMRVDGNNNRISSNQITTTGGDTLVVNGVDNVIVRNTVSGGPFVIAASNTFGPFVAIMATGDLSAVPASMHPQANFVN